MTSILSHLGCRFACAVAACAVMGLAGPVQAQGLPDGLPTSQPTRAQEQEIQQFVRAQFERLRSGDPATVEDARKRLESPFTDRDAPSIAFRLVYGTQVAIELGPMLRPNGGDAGALVNALLVAGRCGTPQTVELLGDALSGKRGPASPAVRAAAVAGLHTVIRDADAERVRRDQGEQAVVYVAQALAKADSPALASACVIALRSTERELLHAKAAEQLTVALPELASSLRNAPKIQQPERWETAIQLGLQLIFRHILQAGGGPLDPNMARAAVEAGAQGLGLVVTRFKDLGPEKLEGAAELSSLQALTDQAEKLMQLAGRSTPGFPGGLSAALADAVAQGDAKSFLDAATAAGRWVQRATGKNPEEFGL